MGGQSSNVCSFSYMSYYNVRTIVAAARKFLAATRKALICHVAKTDERLREKQRNISGENIIMQTDPDVYSVRMSFNGDLTPKPSSYRMLPDPAICRARPSETIGLINCLVSDTHGFITIMQKYSNWLDAK